MSDRQKKSILILLARDSLHEVRSFHLTAKPLVDAGHVVTIIAPRYRDDNPSGTIDGIHYKTFKKVSSPLLRKFHTLFTLFTHAVRSNADVYHVFEVDAPLLAAASAKWIHRIRGMKQQIVFDNSELWPHFYASRSKFKFIRSLIVQWMFSYEWIMVRNHVDGIVAAHEMEAYYYRWIDTRIPVRLAPAGIDFGKKPSRKAGKSGDVRYIGYDGFVTRRNGLVLMLKAFDLITDDYPDAVLVLGGDFGDKEDRAVYESWRKHSQHPERVEWSGWVDRTQQLANLKRFEFGIAPYEDDEHTNRVWPPNKLLNYMGAALPFISTVNTFFQKEMINRTGGGIVVENGSATALAEGMKQFLAHPEETREMGMRGYEFARQHFNTEDARASVLALYADIESGKNK